MAIEACLSAPPLANRWWHPFASRLARCLQFFRRGRFEDSFALRASTFARGKVTRRFSPIERFSDLSLLPGFAAARIQCCKDRRSNHVRHDLKTKLSPAPPLLP